MEQAISQNASSDALNSSVASIRSTQVRAATEHDLDFLVSEAREFSKFYGTKIELFPGAEEARERFTSLMEQHLVLISEVKDQPTGFTAGYLTTHPFNGRIRILSECFWWVKEEFRMGRSGLALLNSFISFGEKHADWITFCLERHSPVNDKTLLKRGFKFQEQGFLLEVE